MLEKQTESEKLFALLEQLPEFCNSLYVGRASERALNTRLSYVRDVTKFFEYLHDTHPYFCVIDIKAITPADMANVSVADMDKFIELYAGNHSPTTAARMKASISSMYEYLTNTLHATPFNPMHGAQKIKLPDKDFVIYLNLEEQEKLLNTIRYGEGLSDRRKKLHQRYAVRDLAMIFLFLDTGLRASEMRGIDNGDFDLEECSVIVRRKGGKLSKIYFSDESAAYIRDYINEKEILYPMYCGRSEAFLISERGTRLTVRQYENIVEKYVAAALPEKKDHISPHKLRSSFALSFYMRPAEEGGRDILALQRRMNHKSLQTTNIYAKAADNISKETRNWRNKEVT